MGCGGSLDVSPESTVDAAELVGVTDRAAFQRHLRAGCFAVVFFREYAAWDSVAALAENSGGRFAELHFDGATQFAEDATTLNRLIDDDAFASLRVLSFRGIAPAPADLAAALAVKAKKLGDVGAPTELSDASDMIPVYPGGVGPHSPKASPSASLEAWGNPLAMSGSTKISVASTSGARGRGGLKSSLSGPAHNTVSMRSIAKLVAASPSLEEFDFSGPYSPVAACMRTEAWLRHERSLVAKGVTDVPPPPAWDDTGAPGNEADPNAVLAAVCRNCPRLRRLNLAGAAVTDFTHVGAFGGALEEINLRGCPGVSDRAVRLLAEGCPRLRRLDLARTTPTADEDPTYHHAVAAYCSVHSTPMHRTLSVAALRHLAAHVCPRETLVALDITSICFEGMSFSDCTRHALELAKALPASLRELRLGNNGALVGDEFVRTVGRRCVDLEVFALDASAQLLGREMCVGDAAVASVLKRFAATLRDVTLRQVGSPSQAHRVGGLGQTIAALGALQKVERLAFETPPYYRRLTVAAANVVLEDIEDPTAAAAVEAAASGANSATASSPHEWAKALLRAWTLGGKVWRRLECLDPPVADAVVALRPPDLVVAAVPQVSRRATT